MKDRLLRLMVAVSVGVAACSSADILFQDTFNRPDNDTDLDAVTTGMTGPVVTELGGAGNIYYESPGNAQILGNQWSRLSLASAVSLLKDFQEGDLLQNGAGKYGMRVSLDVTSNGDETDVDRFVGFGLGYSQESATNMVAWNGTHSLREAFSKNDNGAAGFFVNYTPNNSGEIQIFEGGVLATNIASSTDGTSGTLSAEFWFDAVAAGSNMSYEIFDDGTSVYTGTYTLENDENYVAFGGRNKNAYSGDNFTVETIPEPATIGLMMALGGGLLFVRRRLSL